MEQMTKQYYQMKEKYPDVLLLFHVENSYESYEKDAKVCSDILGISLAKRGKVTMIMFPHYKLDEFLQKLIRAGQRIGICDQLEDPRTKKLAKRGQ